MDNIEAYRQIVQLQAEIVKISQRNFDLKKKCCQLEAELTDKRAGFGQEITPAQPQVPALRPAARAAIFRQALSTARKAASAILPARDMRA
ncbi:MAG TPA: hypothetical protein VHH88_03815 [Verrucomicrobiae bacterium]|nr:hypothetical protein [Verrucomicrobiae bacterium]